LDILIKTRGIKKIIEEDRNSTRKPAPNPLKLSTTEIKERLAGLEQCHQEMLNGLPREQRRVAEASLEGHSPITVAKILGKKEGTTSHARRAVVQKWVGKITRATGLPGKTVSLKMGPTELAHAYALMTRNDSYMHSLFDIAGLTPAQRCVIALSAVGFRGKDIAEVRFCSEKTVDALQYSAFVKLKQIAIHETKSAPTSSELISNIIHQLTTANEPA